MTSKIVSQGKPKTENQFPVAMRWRFSCKYNESDPFKTGKNDLVVLFYNETEGTVLHQKGTLHTVGEYETWIDCKNESWEPFIGTIELTFP
jgi:hypothetical protein